MQNIGNQDPARSADRQGATPAVRPSALQLALAPVPALRLTCHKPNPHKETPSKRSLLSYQTVLLFTILCCVTWTTLAPAILAVQVQAKEEETSEAGVFAAIPYEELSQAEKELARLINEYRREHDLPELKYSAGMAYVSREWTKRNATMGGLTHNPNMLQEFPEGAKSFGENVVLYKTDIKEFPKIAFQWWKNSPSHNFNMLRDDVTTFSLSIYEYDGVYYSTYNIATYNNATPDHDEAQIHTNFDPNKDHDTPKFFDADQPTIRTRTGEDFILPPATNTPDSTLPPHDTQSNPAPQEEAPAGGKPVSDDPVTHDSKLAKTVTTPVAPDPQTKPNLPTSSDLVNTPTPNSRPESPLSPLLPTGSDPAAFPETPAGGPGEPIPNQEGQNLPNPVLSDTPLVPDWEEAAQHRRDNEADKAKGTKHNLLNQANQKLVKESNDRYLILDIQYPDPKGFPGTIQIVQAKGAALNPKTIPAPYRPGYSFQGWYVDPACKNVFTGIDQVQQALIVTLYPKWQKNKGKTPSQELEMGQVIGSAYFMTASGETTGLTNKNSAGKSQDPSESDQQESKEADKNAKSKSPSDKVSANQSDSSSNPSAANSADPSSNKSADGSSQALQYSSLIASQDGARKSSKSQDAKDAPNNQGPVPAGEEESDIDRALRLSARDGKDQESGEAPAQPVGLFDANLEAEPEPGSANDNNPFLSFSQDENADAVTSQVPDPQVLGKMDRSHSQNAADSDQMEAALLDSRKMDTSANKFFATSSREVQRFVNLPVTGEEGTLTFVLIAILGLVFVLTASVVLKH